MAKPAGGKRGSCPSPRNLGGARGGKRGAMGREVEVVERKKQFLQLNGITFQAQCQQHILTDILHSYFHIAIQCILDVSASFNNYCGSIEDVLAATCRPTMFSRRFLCSLLATSYEQRAALICVGCVTCVPRDSQKKSIREQ